MILFDLNQLIISGLMEQVNSKGGKDLVIEESLVRHIVLNMLRSNISKFKKEFGSDIVLCCDARHYWRKDVFKYYKAHRKAARDSSVYDWPKIFEILATLKRELIEYFPYKVIEVERAEADDIIAVLSQRHGGPSGEKVLIISSDGDFIQLQKHPNVKQYSPKLKKFLVSEDPIADLKKKIITGDAGDGVPNILSPDDIFLRESSRQSSMTAGRLEKYMAMNFGTDDSIDTINFKRNQTMIDFAFIPTDIKTSIVEAYDNAKTKPRSNLLNYFIAKKLKNLMSSLGDF